MNTVEKSGMLAGPNEIDTDALQFVGAVQFGSRALDVHSKSWADYDYAVTREIADKILESKSEYNVYPISSYFNVIPKNGKNYLIRNLRTSKHNAELDLLVLEHQSDLDIVAKSVEDIKELDNMYLRAKSNRIKEYQKALKKNGWKYKDVPTAIKLKLKGYP